MAHISLLFGVFEGAVISLARESYLSECAFVTWQRILLAYADI